MVSLFPWKGLDSTTPTHAEALILQYRNLSRNSSGRGSRLPPPPSTASFQVSANCPHISKLSSAWKYPPIFHSCFSSQHYSGGESRHAEAGGSTSHSTGTAAWVAMAAECFSSLPEPKAPQSRWGLPVHSPAFSHHGNGMLLKNELCFPFSFLLTGESSGTPVPFSSPNPASVSGLYRLKACVLSQRLIQA